jgi:hypothetical protein
MLELRPVCENCNKALPPTSIDAMICSFECTFCRECVESVLRNVCPNCGGGFESRPIRPARDWKNGNSLGRYPPSSLVKHRPLEATAHAAFAAAIVAISPDER